MQLLLKGEGTFLSKVTFCPYGPIAVVLWGISLGWHLQDCALGLSELIVELPQSCQ